MCYAVSSFRESVPDEGEGVCGQSKDKVSQEHPGPSLPIPDHIRRGSPRKTDTGKLTVVDTRIINSNI